MQARQQSSHGRASTALGLTAVVASARLFAASALMTALLRLAHALRQEEKNAVALFGWGAEQ